ncbi:MAG: glycosyltransferase family 4 protein [Ruminococcaceae bacterium]|nr:glycosyltransferase family 4 protein [Oscillospiraceae bacterium]
MSKVLYAAGTAEHIKNFHLPYIERLRKEGHEVVTMAKGDGVDIEVPFVKKMFSIKNLFLVLKVRKIMIREGFDTVILNTTLAAFIIRLALPRKKTTKVINFVHGYMFEPEPVGLKEKIFLFCEKLLSSKTDHIIVMNSDDYFIAKRYRLCLGEVRMTRGMGAKISDKPQILAESVFDLKQGIGKYVLCFVGELSELKNQKMLISAMPGIKAHIPNAVLWLVGDGKERRRLELYVRELNLSDSVLFMGKQNNPCDLIRACDIYLSASKKEGMPFNIIEALGCKKTVIASSVKGHKDIIEHGKSGFLFKKDNVGQLVDLIKLIYCGELTIDKGEAFSRYKDFSFDTVFDKTYNTVKELIEA